jgi:hypothetical protein
MSTINRLGVREPLFDSPASLSRKRIDRPAIFVRANRRAWKYLCNFNILVSQTHS